MGLLLSYCFWLFFYRSVRVLRYYQTITCTLISAAGFNALFAKVFELRDLTLTPPTSEHSIRLSQTPLSLSNASLSPYRDSGAHVA